MSPLPATQVLPGWYSVQSFFDIDGHLVKNTALSVVASGGSTLASIYNADGTASANPMPISPQLTAGKAGGADNDGNVQFGAAAGLYDLYAGATYIGTVEVTAQDADLLHTHGDETKHGSLTLDGLLLDVNPASGDGAISVRGATFPAVLLYTGSTKVWGIFRDSDGTLKVQDTPNASRAHITLTPGATSAVALTEIASRLQVDSHIYTSEVDIASSGTTAAYGWYYGGTGKMNAWDYTNNRDHIILTPGATDALALSEFHSRIQADGTILANAAIPIKLPTGTAGLALVSDASGNLALAAIPESGVTGLVTDLAARVLKAGDTMTGSLTLTTTGNGALVWTDGSVAGFAASAGAYSTDALVNDVVIRANSGRLLLQRGSGAAGLIVDSAGITAKQTILANAAVPIKLPTGTAGQVLTSDASGNLALAAPGVANPNQWTENDQLTGGAVTIPMASGGVQQVTMNANVTSATVTGAAKGMLLVLRLKQDATGGRTWTWFTNVVWGPRGAPAVPTAANAQATYTFAYDGTNWVEESRTPVDSGWITATLQNAWVSGTGTDGAPAYRRVDETVYIRGNVKSGVLNTTAFTLPAGFQPGGELDMATTANHAFGDMRILATGAVVPVTGSVTDFFRLTCSFPVG